VEAIASSPDGLRRPLFLTSFAEAVRRNPQGVAVADGTLAVTYQELDLRAASWAARLRDWGIRGGNSVAVSMPSSVDAVVALLAVFRVGAVYVPLDPNRSAVTVDEALDVIRPRLVMTGPVLPPSVADARDASPTEAGSTNLPQANEAPDERPAGGATAYALCIPVAGGGRRRVNVTHAMLAVRLAAARAAYGFQAHHVLCCQRSTASETGLLEMLAVLTSGASLRLRDGRDDSLALAGEVIRALVRTSALARPLRRTTPMVRRSDRHPAGRPQHRPSVTVLLHGEQRGEPSARKPAVQVSRDGAAVGASSGVAVALEGRRREDLLVPARLSEMLRRPRVSGVAKLLLRVLGRSDQSVPRREVSA